MLWRTLIFENPEKGHYGTIHLKPVSSLILVVNKVVAEVEAVEVKD